MNLNIGIDVAKDEPDYNGSKGNHQLF